MQFDSFSSFLDMGGYGFYVWLSFGVSALLIILLIVASNLASKQTREQIARQVRREQKLKLAAEQQKLTEVKNES